jgi:hypothetical protein
LASAGVVTFGVAALLWRAHRLPLLRPKFTDAEVQETWTSGASSSGLMGSAARANNCLWFALTRDKLHVGTHFPFNIFMPLFVARLDLEIPIATISSVSQENPRSGGATFESRTR